MSPITASRVDFFSLLLRQVFVVGKSQTAQDLMPRKNLPSNRKAGSQFLKIVATELVGIQPNHIDESVRNRGRNGLRLIGIPGVSRVVDH